VLNKREKPDKHVEQTEHEGLGRWFFTTASKMSCILPLENALIKLLSDYNLTVILAFHGDRENETCLNDPEKTFFFVSRFDIRKAWR